jgi:hypothetical protein
MAGTILFLANPADVRNFVPGLPLYFAAFLDSQYREGEPAIVAGVNKDTAVLSTTKPWSHAVPSVSSTDFIFVDTGEPCPTCGR